MKFTFLFVLTLVCYSTFSQSSNVIDADSLIENEIKFEANQRQLRIKDFLTKNPGTDLWHVDGEEVKLLFDISEQGLPIYKTTFNSESAKTVGADFFHSQNETGFILQGENLSVAVWDGGLVRHSHVELANRSSQFDAASTFSTHATHVSTTIAGGGINANAKGMVPKANIKAFDFQNDDVEIQTNASNTILSNHSYGLLLGWSSNTWVGSRPDLSNKEDYLFGFYNSNSRTLDRIAYNNPKYLMVWSAGNDRDDNGNSSGNPPDCNEGIGFDCIGPYGVSKNVLTVGAVLKQVNYTSPASVIMSSFSGWGPTDDGRIKPEIVAPGVNLYSASAVNDNSYELLSGTSMAAPTATGALLQLQELYNRLNPGEFLNAATVKALAVHTAKEAGSAPGPDYKFGFGLLDVKSAAQLLLKDENQGFILEEEVIANGTNKQYKFIPKEGTKVKITLSWTDPEGVPVNPSLDPTNLMLINDLDIIVQNLNADVYEPWILDPSNPDFPAAKGNNFRDNLEKIEFEVSLPVEHTLIVNHKNSLTNNSQNYSLLIEYTPINNLGKNFYWIGRNGEWSNISNWSYTSGGSPANELPIRNDKVIFDNNSFTSHEEKCQVINDQEVNSILWLTNNKGKITINDGSSIHVKQSLIANSNIEINGNGRLIFNSATNESKFISPLSVEANNILFESKDNIYIEVDNLICENISFYESNITFKKTSLEARITDISNSSLIFDNSSIKTEKNFLLDQNSNFTNNNSSISLVNESNEQSTASINSNSSGSLNFIGKWSMQGNFENFNIDLNGDFYFDNSLTIKSLAIRDGSILHLKDNELTISQNLDVYYNNQPIKISSENKGKIVLLGGRKKYCFNGLEIANVDILSSSLVSIGPNGQLSNASGWSTVSCENLLLAESSADFLCQNSRARFLDNTQGVVLNRIWRIDGEVVSTQSEFFYDIVKQTGEEFDLELEVSNEFNTNIFSQKLVVNPNTIASNSILLTNGKLFSSITSNQYYWFKDISSLGLSTRSIDFPTEPGVYYVLTANGNCSNLSSPFIVTNVVENQLSQSINVFPNPVNNILYVASSSKIDSYTIRSLNGILIFAGDFDSDNYLDIQNLQPGMYILEIESENKITVRKIIKQ
ncbi:MAG: S8 family serine peptidase [Cytophagales bacterium]|nr:S8 family serine peptidase [Cytophagales bacterium]